jgi:arylsulfatase A-like enzyme
VAVGAETSEKPFLTRRQRVRGVLSRTLSAASRTATVGALVGGAVSICEQIALAFAKTPGITLGLFDRVAGLLLTASFAGAAGFIGGGLGYGLGSLVGERAARRSKVALATFLISTVSLFHALALGLRLMMGSSLTISGLKFFFNSARHMLAAITSQYRFHVAVGVGCIVVVSAVVAVLVARAVKPPMNVRRAELVGVVAMIALTVMTVMAPVPLGFAQSATRTSAELALFSSAKAPRRGGFLGASTLGATALASPELSAAAAWEASLEDGAHRPNLVLVMLESVGANHMGYAGYGREASPNLNRIAKNSLVFTRAYTTATHSNYAQMATLSSLFPRRGGSLDMYERLDYPRMLLHDVASKLGFETATISSQDETWQGMLRFQTTGTPTFYRHAKDYQGEHLELGTEDVAPDEDTVKDAIQWIDSASGSPFSIYINLQSTHFPYPIPKTAAHPFKPFEPQGTFNYVSWDKEELPIILNRYDNALHYVDAQIGALYDALAERGLLEDTVFVVTADHGEMFFEHDLVTHGRTLYEEEARVPLLVHYPDAVTPRFVDQAVSTVDVLPTMLDLAGVPPHPSFQGESVARLGLGAGEGETRQAAVFLNIQGWKHYDAVVCMPYKLVFDPDTQQSALYDLVADPGENSDIAKQKPDVVVTLSAVLQAQLDAQEAYHADDEQGVRLRSERFAPVLLPCPESITAKEK